jgi:hypothetical protein
MWRSASSYESNGASCGIHLPIGEKLRMSSLTAFTPTTDSPNLPPTNGRNHIPTTDVPSSDQKASSKREHDDEVEFLSSNPIKKPKIALSNFQLRPQPLATPAVPATLRLQGSHPHEMPMIASVHHGLSDRRGSTGNITGPSGSHSSDADTGRGVSMPTMERFALPISYSSPTNPTRRSSPALSPKQLPDSISPALLILNGTPQSLTTYGFQESLNSPPMVDFLSQVSFPQQAFISPEIGEKASQLGDQFSQAPSSSASLSAMSTQGYAANIQPLTKAYIKPSQGPAGADAQAARELAASHQSLCPYSEKSVPGAYSCTIASPRTTQMVQQSTNTSQNATSPQQHQSPLSVAQKQIPTSVADGEKQSATRNHPVNFSVGPAKKPCLVCARMRQHAAQVKNCAGSGSVQHATVPASRHVSSGLYPATPTVLGVTASARHSAYNSGHTNGNGLGTSSLTSQYMTYPGRLAFPQNMISSGKPPNTPTTLLLPSFQSQKGTKVSSPAQASSTLSQAKHVFPSGKGQNDTSGGKHIIVDIVDTCLATFPFEEVAMRQQQPVQKVKEVFDAVIQVPLLRCPTDKRRTGKLGTQRMKEYSQAKKGMHQLIQGSTPDKSIDRTVNITAREISQFLPAVHIPAELLHGFRGPW